MFTPLLKDLHGSIGIVSLNRVWDLNGFDNRSDNAMSGNNQQKTILVTGCSSGIGAYCARALKVEGWHVIASARTEEDLATLRNDGIEAYRLDYAEPESIASLLRGSHGCHRRTVRRAVQQWRLWPGRSCRGPAG
jgi:hypothetical protein